MMGGDELSIYYLVKPGVDKHRIIVPPGIKIPGGAKDCYWMLDNGDKWFGVARGIYRPKHEKDIIKEVTKAMHLTRLNWNKTPIHNDNYFSGWLSRDGVFYGCPSWLHDTLAYCVLGMRVGDIEQTGWVRVYDHSRFTCGIRLSAEQRNYLSQNGYRVLESF